MKVKDAMTASVKTIRPEASLKDAAAVFAEQRIGGLPVVADGGQVLGVITEADILLKERAELPPGGWRSLFRRRQAKALAAKVEARTVGEAMSAPAITAEDWWSVPFAAELMLEYGVNRLPVVKDGKVVGIITRHDLVCAFARSDAEIEQDIRDEVFGGMFVPEELELDVQDGEVTLRGEIDYKPDAETLPSLIRRVPGVVRVDSELTAWDLETDEHVLVTVHRD